MFGGFFVFKALKEKKEYDEITIKIKDDKKEFKINYGEDFDVKDLLTKYTGGELTIENNVDFTKLGEYEIVYTVTTENGLKKSEKVKVNIVDDEAPIITLDKDNVEIKIGEEVDLLSGVKAEDNYDEDINDKIKVTGKVDIEKDGTYEIKYDVNDSSNNQAETKTRTYTVKKKEESKIVGNAVLKYGKYKAEFDIQGKNAYITIKDDGTATYVGDMMQNGNFKNVNLTGTWETEANAITMSLYDENKYSGIYFKWSDGTKEGFAIGNNMFGDQWHSYNWVSE